MKWREEVSKAGQVRYLINTEEHADHCMSSCFFGGVLITSQETRDKISKWTIEDTVQKIEQLGGEEMLLMKSYRIRLADISFAEDLNLYLGEHNIRLFSLPGHSTGGIGVYLPEERVVFTTDCVFHRLKTWLPEANPDHWLASLKKLSALDVDFVVPGHGEICNKEYLKEQASIIRNWVDAVKQSIQRGWSLEEAQEKIVCPDPYPKQPMTPMTEAELNKKNISRLYQLFVQYGGML
jgi:glyoxylase-like metal-dependent hydrolase (beta-lactamase superfamily II)